MANSMRVTRKVEHATASARRAMATFRENRDTMGFGSTSAFVPKSKKEEFALFVDRLKAIYMMELLELPPTDPARMALASCNYASVPEPSTVQAMYNDHADPTIRRLSKQCLLHLEAYALARNGLRLIEGDDTELIVFASKAVANNMMASYLWQEVQAELAASSPFKGETANERTTERSEA